MNMELNPLETTMELLNSNWNVSTFTTTKLLEANTFHGRSFWTWSLAPWTLSGPVLMDKFSGPTILSLDNLELETIGPRVTTPKVLYRLFEFSRAIWHLKSRTEGLKGGLVTILIKLPMTKTHAHRAKKYRSSTRP